MSRHEGVSCDSCLTNNFSGRRYKCLVCYDFDLCAQCHDLGVTSSRHVPLHPMQCILTRSDFEVFYGGDILSMDLSQSLTCPHCGKMGFVETSLSEHVTAQHSNAATQVVCPICASAPNGEPNHVTDDLASHLASDHRCREESVARDLVSFDEPPVDRSSRRLPLSARGLGGPRLRRFNAHQRESMDPITELLSQLSGVRRVSSVNSSSSNSVNPAAVAQMHQLQMQLQLEHQQCIERLGGERQPRRRITFVPGRSALQSSGSAPAGSNAGLQSSASALQAPAVSWLNAAPTPSVSQHSGGAEPKSSSKVVSNRDAALSEATRSVVDNQDKAVFVQDIVFSALTKSFGRYVSVSEKSLSQVVDPVSSEKRSLQTRSSVEKPSVIRTTTTPSDRAESKAVGVSRCIRSRAHQSVAPLQTGAARVITLDFSRRKLPLTAASLLVDGSSGAPTDKSSATPVSG